MNKTSFTMKAVAFLVFSLALATAAQAQASRTWVSGVGDDANPCSRTAPCKTFAGAISKTADAGEIDCIDSGGFGAVTITKSITIDGQGTLASILAAGTNGINVNDSASGAPNTHVVAIRNISIQGFATGLVGINFTSGKAVHVEDCVISGFRGNGTSSHGIFANLTTSVAGNQNLKVKNTVIRDNSGAAIRAQNTAVGGAVIVLIDGVRGERGDKGFSSSTNCRALVTNSFFNLNNTAGIEAAAGSLEMDLDNVSLFSNADGIRSSASTTRIANCRITNNSNGINFVGGAVQSFGDNKVQGNGNNQLGGSVTSPPAPVKI